MVYEVEANFYNEGFGWNCRRCEDDGRPVAEPARSRLMSEGESESKSPRLSSTALARWHDREKRELICPNCGTIEAV